VSLSFSSPSINSRINTEFSSDFKSLSITGAYGSDSAESNSCSTSSAKRISVLSDKIFTIQGLSVMDSSVCCCCSSSRTGNILRVEATSIVARGRLLVTGLAAPVTQESAELALTYCQNNLEKFCVADFSTFDKDVHINLKSYLGSPISGPSLGIAITTALLSFFLEKQTIEDLAMTGTISLNGSVGSVGAIEEKVKAAQEGGATTLILPKGNQDDYDAIEGPDQFQGDVYFVKNYIEVFFIVFPDLP
jgi:ATP-dependent Lon protease